jgi:hypothetical protein
MPRNDLKAYTSVIARIPHDLADQVKQYASVHRCSVSELIREGLEMRLDAHVPGRSSDLRRAAGEEGMTEVLQVLGTLSPMLRAAVRETITEVLQGHTSLPQPHAPITERGNTSVIPLEIPVSPPARKGITRVVHQGIPPETADAPVSPHGAGFDPTRFVVGELCPQGHRYQDSAASATTPRRQPGACPGRARPQEGEDDEPAHGAV